MIEFRPMNIFCEPENLLRLERERLFLEENTLINVVTRIERFATKFELTPKTENLAIDITSRYLALKKPQSFKSYIEAGIVLASKLQEYNVPEYSKFSYKWILPEVEREMFDVLEGQINHPTICDFAKTLAATDKISVRDYGTARALSHIAMVVCPDTKHSVLATACHFMACNWTRGDKSTASNLFGIDEEVVRKCVGVIVNCINSDSTTSCVLNRTCFLRPNKKPFKLRSFSFPTKRLDLTPCFNITPHVFGRKEIKKDKILGQGSYGCVIEIGYEGKTYACKRFSDDELSSSLIREYQALSILSHENVVQVHGFFANANGEIKGIVMEKLDCNLESLGKVNESVLVSLTKQLVEGLAHMHSMGVVHRDIKPQNILVERNTWTFKYCDFGISRSGVVCFQPHFTHGIQTLWYRAPEILLGVEIYSEAIDVWSLGCVLYYSLTGKALIPADSEIDALYRIFKIFGTPKNEEWDGVEEMGYYPKFSPMWKKKEEFLDGEDERLKGIILDCLVMNPRERLSSKMLMERC